MIRDDEADIKDENLRSNITLARIMAISACAFPQDEVVNQNEDSKQTETSEQAELKTQSEAEDLRDKVQEIFEKHAKVRQEAWTIKTHEEEVLKRKVKRVLTNGSFAVAGGLWLIVPMLIMTLHPSKLTNLLTASLFIIATGLFLGWSMDGAEPKDIVQNTAAYAAVLVVFVGVQN